MELPDDVLAIVRAYSRPVFKHYQVYNKALKVLGVYGGWLTLKEKLEAETEGVIPALLAYQNALLARTALDKDLTYFMVAIYLEPDIDVVFRMDEQERLTKEIRIARKVEKAAFLVLSAILYPSP
jgi:hypothetical protein